MRRTNKGFTLVEILIVVIILGILAAIVIPQFTEASNDARDSSLKSDLQTARSQLELYKVQHLEKYPSVDETGALDTGNFIARMTGKTDQDGKLNTAGIFGPYLQKFPKNQFVDSSVADVVSFGATQVTDGSAGWWFDTNTGRFTAGDLAHSTD